MNTRALQLVRDPVTESDTEVLDEVESLLDRLEGASSKNAKPIAEARLHAKAALEAGASNETARDLAILGFTADVIAALLLKSDIGRALIRSLVDHVARRLKVPVEFVQAEICRAVLRDPGVNELPVREALDARLKALYFLVPVSDVSLWVPGEDSRLECVACHGEGEPIQARYEEAHRVLHANAKRTLGGLQARAVPVLRGSRPIAALVVGVESETDLSSVLRNSAASLAPILEKDALLGRSAEREKMLVESGERRLARLGFDLHDGPLQDLALLTGDAQLFRSQLEQALTDDERKGLLLGRVDDLDARLRTLDTELRGLAHSYESQTIIARPFEEVLSNEIELFRVRTEIHANLEVEGDFDSLTASQRIALLRVVQEGLSNIREHSGATEVHVLVSCSVGYTHAEVRDNGGGFDVERTLAGAAASGRLGLVGMSERVRLLGGMFDVESRPGGPTAIHVTLPEWRPLVSKPAERELHSTREQA